MRLAETTINKEKRQSKNTVALGFGKKRVNRLSADFFICEDMGRQKTKHQWMVIYISIDFVKVNLQSASYELTSQKSTHHLIEDEM